MMKHSPQLPYVAAFTKGVSHLVDHFGTYLFFAIGWTVFTILLLGSGLLGVGVLCGNPLHELSTIECVEGLTTQTLVVLIILLGLSTIVYLELLYYSVVKLAFALSRDAQDTLSEILFGDIASSTRFIAARVWYDMRVCIGLMFLRVPGCAVGAQDFYVGYSLLDGTHRSFQEDQDFARQLGAPYFWQLLFMFIVHGSLVMVLTFLPITFFVSILLVWPIISSTDVQLYHFLKDQQS